MPKIVWHASDAAKKYQTGIDHGLLYTGDFYEETDATTVTPWNGLTAVNEAPTGAEVTKVYADNIHYLSLISKEEFGATIEAFDSPDNFQACEGVKSLGTSTITDRTFIKMTAQPRAKFGLAYRSACGNAADAATALAQGYIYHFVYDAKAGVSANDHNTINDSPDAPTKSWELTTTAKTFTVGDKTYTTAHFEVDGRRLTSDQYDNLLAYLADDVQEYGIPTPENIGSILNPAG